MGDGKGEEGMKILLFLSDAIIPLLIFSIVGYGLMAKQNVYDDFIDGAKDGFHTVIQRSDDRCGDPSCVRIFGFYFKADRTVDRAGRISFGTGPGHSRKDVFILRGNRTGARYF